MDRTWAREGDQEVTAKALDLPAPVLGKRRARTPIDRLWTIELLASARQLRSLLEE